MYECLVGESRLGKDHGVKVSLADPEIVLQATRRSARRVLIRLTRRSSSGKITCRSLTTFTSAVRQRV